MRSTVHSVCSLDCPDSCGVLVTVEDGRATRVAGDPMHPVTRGFLCGKVARYLDRVYAPDRLLQPMRRRAGTPKGALRHGMESDSFEPISWEEALATIAAQLGRISAEHGPESILPYSYAGTIGLLGYASMDRRFFHRLGASQLDRTICASAGGEAMRLVYGTKLGTDTEDFRHARLIVCWGANTHGNNIHLWPFIEEARRAGARLVVIDPYRTRTAALADVHLAPYPGSDTALALGLMHVILRDGLHDADFIAAHTHGFPELQARAREYPPERVEQLTGIARQDVEQLARSYATTQPAAIRLNYGVQRSECGGTAVRAIAMLPALTGAWRHQGGGLQLSTSGAFHWDHEALERPDLMMRSPLGRHARVINMTLVGEALCARETLHGGPPVHALFVYNSNPAAIAPDQAQVLAGLRRNDLFTVVHDQFFTDTADYADIVLPATSFLERSDMQGAYGHYYVQFSEQAIAPLGEARSNTDLFRALARHCGFDEPCFKDTDEQLMTQALGARHPHMEGMTLGSLKIAEGRRERLHFAGEARGERFRPYTDGQFATPSGKIEFCSSMLAAEGRDGVPDYTPPAERRGAEPKWPLEFLPRKADNYMNSTFANHPAHQRMEQRTHNALEIHPADAEARGIASGDAVRVENSRGAIELEALVSDRVQPGVVAARLGWNKLSPGWVGINQLTSQRLTDLGRAPTFYSTLVEVSRIRDAHDARARTV